MTYKTHLIDELSISHFIIYYIIGKIYPNNYKHIIILSISWEIIEQYVATRFGKELSKYWIIPLEKWNDSFLHAVTDIIFNLLGYYFAHYKF